MRTLTIITVAFAVHTIGHSAIIVGSNTSTLGFFQVVMGGTSLGCFQVGYRTEVQLHYASNYNANSSLFSLPIMNKLKRC